MDRDKPVLLITGINGYIGSWVTLKALESGEYRVRGTVRDKTNEYKVQLLRNALGDKFDELELVNADLTDKNSLKEAVKGCDYVIHVASPFPLNSPKNEDDVIKPAVEGTLGIIQAWVGSDVKRIVATSSLAAVMDYSKGDIEVDETNWPEITKLTTPYIKSKILAEKAAWEYIDSLPEKEKTFDYVALNPGLVTGPLLVNAEGSSQAYITNILKGKLPGIPWAYIPIVDVRDVADAHLRAMKAKSGERYALTEGTYFFPDVGKLIHEEFSQYGYKASRKEMCKSLAWLFKCMNKDMKYFYSAWKVRCHVKNDKAKKELGMKFITAKQSIIDMCYSLIDHGLVVDKRKKKK